MSVNYTRVNFQNGDRLQASDLNHMDEQIEKLTEQMADVPKVDDSIPSSSSTWSSKKIADELEKISYVPIKIESFQANPSVAEVGETINATLSWKLNKKPASIKIDSESVSRSTIGSTSVSDVAAPANYPEANYQSWSLSVTDKEGALEEAVARIYFYNGVYHGVADEVSQYSSEFISSLHGKLLRGSKNPQFTVTAGDTQYIYYCQPTRYGQCKFTVNGFTGGFSLVATIPFTNAYGYTENYYIYRSDNSGLGQIDVVVS